MSADPYVQLYTSDFLGGTSGLTASTKGVYITLLCLMYETETPLGQSWDTLARRCGCTLPAFKKAVDELRDDRKVTVSEDGIWSEKCDKHIALRRERRNSASSAAKKRWKKEQEKQSGTDAGACHPQCENDANQNQNQNQKEIDKSISSAREPKSDQVKETVEAIWPKLPKRKRGLTSKAKLAKPVGKILKAGTDPQRLIAAVTACYTLPRHTEDDGQFAPAVYSWLSDGVWENWCSADGGGESPDGETAPLTDDHWRSIFRTWCETGQWPTALAGPSPESPDCRAPAEMIKTAMEWKAGRAA